MPRSKDSKLVAFSVNVYARLLGCYPRGHREEYGPAMAQLFRDQCRAEWHQTGARGLMVLWLRVLVDLLTTSTAEHFRNLKQRIFMLTKLRGALLSDPSLRATFRGVFVVVFALSLCASVLLAFSGATLYSSMARIEMGNTGVYSIRPNQNVPVSYDPYVMQRQFEQMTSDPILGRVAKKLNLAETWGSASAGKAKLSDADTIEMLRSRLELRPLRNTSLVEIRSLSSNPEEAASIANELAGVFREFSSKRLPAQWKDVVDAPTRHSSVAIADYAEPDSRPVQPNIIRTLFLGSLGGIVLAAFVGGAGVLFVYFNRGVSVPS